MSKHLGVEYKVRMPQELKDKISESAKELNRSMNADIVARLEQTFAFEEANKDGKFVATEESQMILTKSLNNVLSKLISNLLDEGVDPKALSRASKLMVQENSSNESDEK
ncbi:hypothetical protein C9426_01505 [Serratia sp. S1B]|nr:hypothetical protein C9426_01505 [Serratia sp. S1B]